MVGIGNWKLPKQLFRSCGKLKFTTSYTLHNYNECYVSNAEASAPFVYPEKGSVGNPVEFLNSDKVASKTEFLRKYAHDNDEVFIVFGD